MGSTIKVRISPNKFTDPDEDVISYSLEEKGKGKLPNWVTFNPEEIEVVYHPNDKNQRGIHIFELKATDKFNSSKNDEFKVEVFGTTP